MRSCATLFFLIFPAFLQAEELFLDAVVQAQFKPVAAYLLVEDKDPVIYAAAVVPAEHSSASSGWRVAARCQLTADTVKVTALVTGSSGEVAASEPQTIKLQDAAQYRTPDLLRAQLISIKEKIKNLETAYQLRTENMIRLQTDAEQIGSQAQIDEARAELARINQQIEQAVRETEKVRASVAGGSLLPAPVNAIRREAELGRQIQELATAAHAAEADERRRRSVAAAAAGEKLEAISRIQETDPEHPAFMP